MSTDDVRATGAVEATTPAMRASIEIAIRLGAIAMLVFACVTIIAPFLGIVAWALIMAIAMDGPNEKLCRWFGGRRKLAAITLVLVMLLLLIVPAVLLSDTLVSGARSLAHELRDGSLQIPPPDPSVADWPVVGDVVFKNWKLASENLGEAPSRL